MICKQRNMVYLHSNVSQAMQDKAIFRIAMVKCQSQLSLQKAYYILQ